jgi:cytidylate kinase
LKKIDEGTAVMKKYAVTIAREYGSGGRIIGKELAGELGIAFYDRELIAYAAKDMGLDEGFVQAVEQKRTSGFLYNFYSPFQELPIPEQIFLAQSKVIKELAEKGSCVIIGRCADYVLKDCADCIRIFIYAPTEYRVNIVKEVYGEDKSDPEAYILKQDRMRAAYYNFYTQQKWGKTQNYNLCLDSSIGVPASLRVLKKFVEEFEDNQG